MVCYGIDDTMKSLHAGAVTLLVVFENLEHIRVTLKNKTTESIIFF